MARGLLDRQLTAARTRFRLALATPRDDAAVRHLLRSSPMQGAVSLSFEREPNCFDGHGIAGAEDRVIVACEHDRLVCMGRASVRLCHVNGQICRVGYLGELRLARSAQGRFGILRRGFQFFREQYRKDPPALWFTCIGVDNQRSRRFLERNLRGMPRYERLGEFATLLIPVPRRPAAVLRLVESAERRLRADGLHHERATEPLVEGIVECLSECARRAQFSMHWTVPRLRSLDRWGLLLHDFHAVMDGPQVVACGAFWDQRRFRQTVVRGYTGPLALVRPLLNIGTTVLGRPGLPAVGATLAHAFLSPLACRPGCHTALLSLVALNMVVAHQRRIDFLTAGFAAADPALPLLRRQFRPREYRSCVYRVSWPGDDTDFHLEDRAVAPEVALL